MPYNNTFDPLFFERLKKAEASHFWFHVRKWWIYDKIRKLTPPPAQLLDVGCGTGNVSSFLTKKGYDVTGCEFHENAIMMAWPGTNIVRCSAQDLPFENGTFDIVCLFDVIEHFNDDHVPLREATRVLRDNGLIAITVPAREELWSIADERSLHKRRYTKHRLKVLLQRSGLSLCLLEYMFMSLYLPMMLMRKNKIKLDLQYELSDIINIACMGTFHIERIASKWISLPVGTSLIAIARRNSNETS